MIFYFSAIGNTKHVVDRIKRENEEIVLTENAEGEISKLITQLNNEITGKHMSLTTPLFIGNLGKKIYDNKTRKTSNLSVTNDCIECGLCARKCPIKAIEMIGKKPIWVKEECTM